MNHPSTFPLEEAIKKSATQRLQNFYFMLLKQTIKTPDPLLWPRKTTVVLISSWTLKIHITKDAKTE